MEPDLRDSWRLTYHRLAAEKIRGNPALLGEVASRLALMRVEATHAAASDAVIAWQQALDIGMDAILALATEETARATALRERSPFMGCLSKEERAESLKPYLGLNLTGNAGWQRKLH